MTDRNRLIILGVDIGTYTEWDRLNDWNIIFYDVILTKNQPFRLMDVQIDFESGAFEFVNQENEETMRKDAIDYLFTAEE